MISHETFQRLFRKLGLLPYFPADSDKELALTELIHGFATTDDQLDWLGSRMLTLYRKWPGPLEMRACFCSKFKVSSGPNTTSLLFAEGIPSERQSVAPVPASRRLPSGQREEPIDDPESREMIAKLEARIRKVPSGAPVNTKFEERLREVVTPPQDRPEKAEPTPQIITQADIDKAVLKYRDEKARKESGRAPKDEETN